MSAPYVTKPVDSQGQRGIFRVDTPQEALQLRTQVLEFSRERRYLVEEYYPSTEVTLSGWVDAGRTIVYTITDRITVEMDRHIGVCIAHRYPSVHTEEHGERIHALTRRIVEGFGIRQGPIYFQFLVGEQGVIVNEIACRLGGAYEDRFLPRLTGVDVLDLLIDQALGLVATPDPPPGWAPAAPYVSIPLLFCHPGVIDTLSDIEDVRTLPGVVAAQWLQQPGTRIVPMANSTQRAAYLIVEGRGPDETNRRLAAALQTLHAWNEEGRDLMMDVFESIRHRLDDRTR
jgi:biotin carboxylase